MLVVRTYHSKEIAVLSPVEMVGSLKQEEGSVRMKSNYSVLIVWSEEDKAFLASVPELPGCVADGSTRKEAVENLEAVIEEWIETAKGLGRSIPTALED